jgi:hypothetical protein
VSVFLWLPNWPALKKKQKLLSIIEKNGYNYMAFFGAAFKKFWPVLGALMGKTNFTTLWRHGSRQ